MSSNQVPLISFKNITAIYAVIKHITINLIFFHLKTLLKPFSVNMVSTYLIFTWSAIVILSWHKAFEFVASLVKYFQLLSFYVFHVIRNHRCCKVHSWSMVISYDMLKNLRQISWRLDRLLLSRNSFQTFHQLQQDVLQIQARYFHLLFLWILYWSSDSVLSCGFTKPNQPTDHVLVIIKLTICCLRCFKKNKSH